MSYPDYMNQPGCGPFMAETAGQGGLGLVQESLPLNMRNSPKEMERMKAEAQKAHRSSELTEIARNLEYLRARLIMIDVPTEAKLINDVIHALVTRWDSERDR